MFDLILQREDKPNHFHWLLVECKKISFMEKANIYLIFFGTYGLDKSLALVTVSVCGTNINVTSN